MKINAQQAFDRLSKLVDRDRDGVIDSSWDGDRIDIERSARNNRESAKDLFLGACGKAGFDAFRELRDRQVSPVLAGLAALGVQAYTTAVAPISFGLAVNDLLQARRYERYGEIIGRSGEDFPVI